MPGAPKPALPTDAAQWVTDYNAMTFTNDCSAYRDLIQSYPVIAEAMDYANLPVTLRTGRVVPNTIDGIWATIDNTVTNGFVATVTLPVDHAPTGDIQRTHFTVSEAYNTYAAKIAHALWLEVTGAVPWKLVDYNLADLEYLLHRDKLFLNAVTGGSGWDQYSEEEPPGPFAKQTALCDHSPKLIYDITLAQIGTPTTRRNAISDLLLYGGATFSHGGTSPGSRTIAEFETDGYSSGCGPMSTLMVAYARSLNIGGRVYFGKFLDTGHASYSMLTKSGQGFASFHGDDTHSIASEFPTYQGWRVMPDFADWNTRVGEEADDVTARLEAGDIAAVTYTRFPPTWLIDGMEWGGAESSVLDGWAAYVGGARQPFGPPYRSYAQQAAHLEVFRAHAGDVDLLPPDINATNTGQYSGTLTPVSGPLTIDDAWVSANQNYYELIDFTGTLTINVTAPFTLRRCRINGNGGVGVNVVAGQVYINRCEMSNCTNAITGAPYIVFANYLHSNTDAAFLIDAANPGPSLDSTTILYNYIDAGASNSALRVTTGTDTDVICNANRFVSTATGTPLISLDGSHTGTAKFQYNWLDGGNYCIYQNRSIPAEFVVNANQFGRNAATGLYQSDLGTAATWVANIYEDNGDTANSTDTAPL